MQAASVDDQIVRVVKFYHNWCGDLDECLDTHVEPCIRENGIQQWNVVWQGSAREFYAVCTQRLDLTTLINHAGSRILDCEDYDYATWVKLYQAFEAWYQAGRPAWNGSGWKSYGNSFHMKNAARVLDDLKAICCIQRCFRAMMSRRSEAARRIQRCYRNMMWRRHVLWNPYSDVGCLHLSIQFRVFSKI